MKPYLKKVIIPTFIYILGISVVATYEFLKNGKVILDTYSYFLLAFFYILFLLLTAIFFFPFYMKINSDAPQQKKSFIYGDEQKKVMDIKQNYEEKINKLQREKEIERNLFSSWVHEIKTPVSSTRLLLERMDMKEMSYQEGISEITEQNQRIERCLNQMLDLKRLDEFSRDYYPQKINLKELIEDVINDEKKTFIFSSVFPKLNMENTYIYTDKKWCKELIKQIITNAIKYSRKDSYIDIFTDIKEDFLTLAIKDYGIGIKEYDQVRIFEPFFTGENGRLNKFSSGIGLYIAKEIAGKLSVRISFTSEINKGTTFFLTFLQNCKII